MNHEINALLDQFKTAATASTYGDRKKARERIRAHMLGRHWDVGDKDQAQDPIDQPSVQLVWLAAQRQMARIFGGYDFRAVFVPESRMDYLSAIDSPLRRLIATVPGETDPEKEAAVRTALADRLAEAVKLDEVLRDAAGVAQWYGEAWLLDGWADGAATLDVLHPDNAFKDPGADCLDKSRFVGYKVKRAVSDLMQQYPDHADDIEGIETGDKDIDDLPAERRNLDLECWFIRDNSTRKALDRIDIAAEEWPDYEGRGYTIEAEHTALVDLPMEDPLFGLVPGIPQVVGMTVVREYDEPKHPGGWRHVKRIGKVIVEDGESYSASGELPMHWVPWYPVPGEFHAQGLPDQVRDLAMLYDQLTADAIRYARTAIPFVLKREGVTLDGELAALTEQGHIVRSVTVSADEPSVPIGDVVRPVDWPSLPGTYSEMLSRLQALIEEITGSADLRGENMAFDQASGEAIVQYEAAANQRTSMIRGQLRRVVAGVVKNLVANAIAYSEETYSIEVGQVAVDVSPPALEDADVERTFDVRVDGSDSLPAYGDRRNQAIIRYVGILSAMPPPLALATVDMLDLPIAAELKQAIQALAPPEDEKPEQVDDAAQATRKRAGENLADALETIAKSEAENPGIRMRSLQALADMAVTGQPPDISSIITGAPIAQEDILGTQPSGPAAVIPFPGPIGV